MAWKIVPPTDKNPAVVVVFDGYLDAREGEASAVAFRAALADKTLAVVWDLTRMAGFDGGARTAWADAVWPIRKQISRLTIVGARGMTRIGATFLVLLLGAPHEFVDGAGVDGADRAG
jgi:hypothetical protein